MQFLREFFLETGNIDGNVNVSLQTGREKGSRERKYINIPKKGEQKLYSIGIFCNEKLEIGQNIAFGIWLNWKVHGTQAIRNEPNNKKN